MASGGVEFLGGDRLFLISGPCVIESRDLVLSIANTLAGMGEKLGLPVVFKASYDKANRSSGRSFRGPGIEEGLKILSDVRDATGLPVLTDVHLPEQAAVAGEVVDILQIPAFLSRQTDLVAAAAATGKAVNIKKAQFMAPRDTFQVVAKARDAAAEAGVEDPAICLTERGSCFGYNNLVVDMRSLPIMAETGCPVIFDATHSVQLPGGQGDRSGGERQHVPTLARAAVAAGVSGLFMETHPDPDKALSDGPNSWPLDRLEPLIAQLLRIREACEDGCPAT
ncbi:3-deoxy-8-phosphooctulonate synthase [Croceicoccus gelatinilyticus]|uniref:3-deoxy-8-phosphooctulonate synthase n=1 Tax=Croceicoccus gelatinilyticus TaxID=2835536 RepID=UPI001BCFD0D3|nr:3-deoxy-8-phosphooctulonate synthase [Croceicoccus gelatinilyticus]MBS7671202.1 3-deoxy-8-phosphooctulonate synthase [Croceicoccus gelatinilyticus]